MGIVARLSLDTYGTPLAHCMESLLIVTFLIASLLTVFQKSHVPHGPKVGQLNENVLVAIFSLLDARDLARVRQVSD